MSVGIPTSVQSSTVTLEDTRSSPHEAEWNPAEVVPVVTPPSLEEVQQAVQEDSEKVEGGTAEEVLKRVMEAALGQVEGKQDELAVQEGEGEDPVGPEDETEVKVSEQVVVGIDDSGKEEAEERVEAETVADNMEQTTVGVETVGTEAVIDESIDTKDSQKVLEETLATLEEMGKDIVVDSEKVEDSNQQVVILDGRVKTETTPTVQDVDFGREPVQETGTDTDPSLVNEQIGTVGQMEEDAVVGEVEGQVITLPSDNSNTEATKPLIDEPAVSEDNYTMNNPQSQDDVEQSHVKEKVGAIEIEGAEMDSEGSENHQDILDQGYEVLVDDWDKRQAGVEEVPSPTSYEFKEEPETTVIFAPEPEDDAEVSIEQRPGNQGTAFTEVAENVVTDHGNEILSPTDDLLACDSNKTQPMLDSYVNDVLVIPPQARGELVEHTVVDPETKEMGQDAWKIGATIAAVFLVLETVVIAIYIFQCRNKTSSLATQHSCEDGCVEPEVTTGCDSSDDTLHAGNGDTRQIAATDLCDAVTTLAQNSKGHKLGHVISMSKLPNGATENSTKAGPDSSQVRTSML
ncbi:uncharacterized protein LOC144020274 [Festucalex cinctus]